VTPQSASLVPTQSDDAAELWGHCAVIRAALARYQRKGAVALADRVRTTLG
jgi:hypothetical protein